MSNHSADLHSHQAVALAPGDEVARYVEGKPVYCTVIEVVDEGHVLVEADLWPTGYTALVPSEDVSLLWHKAS